MYRGVTRNPINVILLSIVTCGIYSIVWLFAISKEINEASGQKVVDPVIYFLLGILCFPLIFVGMFKIDEALFALNTQRGLPANKNFVMWLVLSLVGVGTFIMMYQVQEQLNKLWAQP